VPTFGKLSANQWKLLIDLVVYHYSPSTRRRLYLREAYRVATIRAMSALQRRGLIRKDEEGYWEPTVTPRELLGAAARIEPPSVDLDDLRGDIEWREERARREARKEARREARSREQRDTSQPTPDPPLPHQLDCVAAALKMCAADGGDGLDSLVIWACSRWWSMEFVIRCLDILRADGSYDRIIAEARATAK
jgi:hypothetical protein